MKPNAVFSNPVIRNGNSDGQSSISLPAPSRFNGNSVESNRAIQNLNSRFGVQKTEREKTPADFLRRILIEQPIDTKQKPKPLNVELKLNKPPEESTTADYQMATRRAIFTKAGYGMLTDEEINLAAGAMKDTGWTNEQKGFDLANLRRADAKAGAMFLKTDTLTIQAAQRAGQAVLQYQEDKSKRLDAAIEKGQNYATEALGGFAQPMVNAPVNVINGISEPFRAGEQAMFGTKYIPEIPRMQVAERSEYWN